jgi:hypothetical protein
MTFTINSNANSEIDTSAYAQLGGGATQTLPALQLSDYAPKANSKFALALSEDSVDLLSADFGLSPKLCVNGITGEEYTVFVVPAQWRWVVLAPPTQALVHKADGTYLPKSAAKGTTYANLGVASIAKVYLAAITADGKLVKGGSGLPQVFGLTLKANRAALVGSLGGDYGAEYNNGMSTLMGLNAFVGDKKPGWWARTVSVAIHGVGVMQQSKKYGNKLMAKFAIDPNSLAHVTKPHLDSIQALLTSDYWADLTGDPFGLNGGNLQNNLQNGGGVKGPQAESDSEWAPIVPTRQRSSGVGRKIAAYYDAVQKTTQALDIESVRYDGENVPF